MRLIPEKITVPQEMARLARPRLLALLKNSLASCTSTVISGRAGTGKTALAVDFARVCGRPVAWYKVDGSDVELRVFLRYLIASIRQHRPEFNGQQLLSLAETEPCDHPVLAESLVYELLQAKGEPLLIVIDDLHLVCDAEWVVPFLHRLFPLLPHDVHMLITSRTLPPAPLWRMRSKQTLEVIDEATLAFTRQEAVELFESYGVSGVHLPEDYYQGRASALGASAIALSKLQIAEANVQKNTPRSHTRSEALRLAGSNLQHIG